VHEPRPVGRGLTEVDRLRHSAAFRELRRRHWERPLVLPEGEFAARAMPPELILPWESEEQIIEQELPDYRKLGWHVEDWPAGLLLIGPHRIPELLDPGQLLHPLESEPGIPEPEPDMPAIVVVDGVVLVAPDGDDPASA